MGWTNAQIGIAAAAGTAAFLAVAWPTVFWYEVKKLEKPRYSTVKTLAVTGYTKRSWVANGVAALFCSHVQRGHAELRMYAPTMIAEVEVEDEKIRGAMSHGFRQIAGFIFGKNTAVGSASESEKVVMTSPVIAQMPKAEKVAMTSPVVAEMDGDNKYRVSFVMPSKYTIETIPKPLNPNVKIREVPGRLMAALGFSGKMPSVDRVHEYVSKLEDAMKAAGLEKDGPPMLYQYHPPFAPGFIRHNEVLLPVKQ